MSNWKKTSEELPQSEYESVMFKLQNGYLCRGYYEHTYGYWRLDAILPIKFRFDDVYEWCYEKEYKSNE